MPLSNLLHTDVPLLILDPIRLLQAPSLAPVLPFLLAHPHLQIIINGAIPSSSSLEQTRERLHRQLAHLVPGFSSDKGTIGIGFVRADKALSAIEALGQGIAIETEVVEDRSEAIGRFQHDFTASNFGPLQEQLSFYLGRVAPPNDRSVPTEFQVQTAKTTLNVTLAYISNIVLSSSRAARAVQSSASALRQEVQQRSEHARQNSVVSRGISSGIVEGSVEEELGASEREVRALMGERLSWKKVVLGAVDDVGEEVAAEVQKCFGRDLEERVGCSDSINELTNVADLRGGRAGIAAAGSFTSSRRVPRRVVALQKPKPTFRGRPALSIPLADPIEPSADTGSDNIESFDCYPHLTSPPP